MNPILVLGVLGTTAMLVLVCELLRRRHLRGKYAVLWIAVATGSLVLTAFPGVLRVLADLTGVEVASNLLFFLALLLLALTSIQHSYEVGRLEERTRILAEEVALLRLEPEARQDPSGRAPALRDAHASATPGRLGP